MKKTTVSKGIKKPKPAITQEPKTKKTDLKQITNLIIIDASGSMASKVEEVKGGLKVLFQDIQKDAKADKGKINQSTVLIDFSGPGDFRELVNSSDHKLLTDKVADSYSTRGMTALYDAIGKAFGLVPDIEKEVFVSILTDGEENSSHEFKYQDIKNLIETKRKLGWTITFMGTTEAAVTQARAWGISGGNIMTFTDSSKGVAYAHSSISVGRQKKYDFLKSMASGQSAQMDNLMEEVNEDETIKKLKKEADDNK